MASESPNPYAPSSVVDDEAQAQAGRPARWLAAFATLLCLQPLAGVGLYVLGRRRRVALWAVPSAFAFAMYIAGGWLARPGLFAGGLVALIALALASFVDTLIVRPAASAPSLSRALVVVGLVFAGERAGLYAVKHGLVEAFEIPGNSMAPSLRVGDHVLVSKLRPSIERGAVIVHRYPRDRSMNYVKRIVALGGDTFEIRNARVVINGSELPVQATTESCPRAPDREGSADCQLLREVAGRRSYLVMLEGRGRSADNFGPVTVPQGSVVVLGDNRNNSMDSRIWGYLPNADILGTVSFVFWTDASGSDGNIDRWGTKP